MQNLLMNDQKIVMNTDRIDSNKIAVTFDLFDLDDDQVVAGSGYVMIRQDNEGQCFYITVFNQTGDVLSETKAPFNFQQF